MAPRLDYGLLEAPGLDSGLLEALGPDSGFLGPPGLNSNLLRSPGPDSGLLEAPGLDSGLLGPIGLDSGLPEAPGLNSSWRLQKLLMGVPKLAPTRRVGAHNVKNKKHEFTSRPSVALPVGSLFCGTLFFLYMVGFLWVAF